jgi:hypothetical protein
MDAAALVEMGRERHGYNIADHTNARWYPFPMEVEF